MESEPGLAVVYLLSAQGDLELIWDWNLEHNGRDQANAYLDFLYKEMDSLGTDSSRGKTVPSRPDLQYITMRWRAGGFGHVAVYRSDSVRVIIVHVFHSSQDWHNKILD